MIGPRIEPVTCPECGLRASVRARPSGSPESFVNDNTRNASTHGMGRQFWTARA
jgi:hypothetical protein